MVHFTRKMLLDYFDSLAHSEILPAAFHVIANFSHAELKGADLNKVTPG